MTDQPRAHPRYTVVVPTHGRSELLGRAVRSVLVQTVADFEIVVVDDGGASGALDEHPDLQDPRIRVVSRPHGGASGARNTGIRSARGEFVTFLDDDDEFTPNRLALADQGLAFAPISLCWKAGLADGDLRWARQLDGDVSRTLLEAPVPQIGSAAIRRDVVLLMDETLPVGEDVEWWLRMSTRGRFHTVPEVGYLIRDHEGARLRDRTEQRLAVRLRLLRENSEYFRHRPRAEAYHWKRAAGLASETGHHGLAARCTARSLLASLRTLVRRRR